MIEFGKISGEIMDDLTSQNSHDGKVENEITEIFEKICRAFGKLDIDLALSYFADSENMVKISNGHVLRGKKQLSEYWNQNLAAAKAIGISIYNVEVFRIDEKHVWTTAEEHISLDEQHYRAIVTNIFVSTSSGWKILMDHTTTVKPE